MTTARKGTRRAGTAVLVTLAALASGGCLGGSDGAAAPSVRVETTEMRFEPARLEAGADTPVVIVVDNVGEIVHTFSVNELGIEVKVNPGETRRVTLDGPAATYQYVCRILDHEGLGMVGQLTLS